MHTILLPAVVSRAAAPGFCVYVFFFTCRSRRACSSPWDAVLECASVVALICFARCRLFWMPPRRMPTLPVRIGIPVPVFFARTL